MIVQELVFYFFSLVMLFAAVSVVTVRNPVYAVLFLVLTFFNPVICTSSSTTRIFFPIESTSVNLQSGNMIASGSPGKPPPVPTSMIVVPGVNRMILAKDKECRMCLR